jgi:hypothetical protein
MIHRRLYCYAVLREFSSLCRTPETNIGIDTESHIGLFDACPTEAWPAQGFDPQIDQTTGRLTNGMPLCPRCGKLARPNILMFGDWAWVDKYSERQLGRLAA